MCVLLDDEADSQTEGEELELAREMRMQEVKLKPLPYLPTDTETEVSFFKSSFSIMTPYKHRAQTHFSHFHFSNILCHFYTVTL